MIYPILSYGNTVLKQKATIIDKESLDIKQLSEDMFETMYHAQGVGLAAPQIGKSIRLFVIDAEEMDKEKFKGMKKVFVNPQVIEERGDMWGFEEGCLSIPGIREEVKRNTTLKIKYQDENWNEHEEEFSGVIARIIQHEYDHLEGVLFTDYLSSFKKRLLKSKLSDISKGKVNADYPMVFP